MSHRVAVLLDGGYVTKKLGRISPLPLPRPSTEEARSFPSASDVLGYVEQLLRHPRLEGHRLLRIYFYDAPPLEGTRHNPLSKRAVDFSRHPTNALNRRLQDSLAHSPDVAVRRGETVFRGWRLRPQTIAEIERAPRALTEADLMPDVEQKGVDLRIGLDVAMLAFRRLVETVVLVSGDSDLVPAMKLARREGLRVYLDPLGAHVRPSLSEHADFVFPSL